jgi:hypothetical protein
MAGVTYPVLRQQCVDDLNKAVRPLLVADDSVVIVEDFNETLGTNPTIMASVCTDHNFFIRRTGSFARNRRQHPHICTRHQEAGLRSHIRKPGTTYRRMRIAKVVKPTTPAALTKVEIVSTQSHIHPHTGQVVNSTTAKLVDTCRALEDAIIAQNKQYFAQADGSPSTRPPLARIGSSNGYSLYRDEAGRTIKVPEDSFVETQTLMELLRERLKDPIVKWSEIVSFEEFIAGFLHWNEQTSTSPSDRHLGLYGALVTVYCNSSGEFSDQSEHYKATTKEMAEQILQMIHGLASSAARLGFYLYRWIHVVNVMIYKKPGCIELDRLRLIHLFEADFNLIIGILFGRQAMYHQVDNRLLNTSQFGRPGGECPNASITKVFHNLTLLSLTHTPMGQFENDATACFDREVMKFVLACYHSTGAPLGPLKMWEQVLYNIVHKVKTGFGLSNEGYIFSSDSPIYGPGQGSRGGPGSCATMTSVLIDGMPRLCNGLQFTNPAQQLQYTATVKMFIDDISNCTNRFLSWLHEPPQLDEVVEMTRHDSQTWLGAFPMDVRRIVKPYKVCILYYCVAVRRRRAGELRS